MTSPKLPISLFDSGIGGLSLLRALVEQLLGESFRYVANCGDAPTAKAPLTRSASAHGTSQSDSRS